MERRVIEGIDRNSMLLLVFEYLSIEPWLIVLVPLAPCLDGVTDRERPLSFCLKRLSIAPQHVKYCAYIFYKSLI
jgi:hypothetical protein